MDDVGIIIYIAIGFIAILLEALVANKFESIANEKGYSGYFLWCFFFSIIGYIMVAALPDKKGMEETQKQIVSALGNQTPDFTQQSQPQYQSQQPYWNNNLPPL